MDLKLSYRYEPLFSLLDPTEYTEVSVVIITGGRNSQKSFATSLFACIAAKDHQWNALYTRYTLVSAQDSIIPDFNEKLELLDCYDQFNVTKDRIEGNNGSKIVFKGIKTSAGNQTAALKSLKGFNLWLYDEGEEHPDFDSWDKIQKSIRSNTKRNLSIILLNPTSKESWIYKTFFEERGVEDGFNGVVGNVMYIHTTYMDLERDIIADNIFSDFEEKRLAYEEWIALPARQQEEVGKLSKFAKYFKHTILGGWLPKAEGVIFENWVIGSFQDVGYTLFGADFGFSTDETTLVNVSIDKKGKRIYLKELVYQSKLTTSEIYRLFSEHARKSLIIADSAEPRLIEELKRKGLNIKAAVKGPGSITAGIALMLDYELVVDASSSNLIKELNNYTWHDKKSNVPIDAYNHIIDGARYAISELLNAPQRMQGSFARAMRGR